MSLSRIVQFEKKQPSKEEIGLVLEDYLEEAAEEICWMRDRYFVTLKGKTSYPLRRIDGVAKAVLEDNEKVAGRPRMFWVWIGKEIVEAGTMDEDYFTSAIVEGLVAILSRFWDGDAHMVERGI